MQTDAVRAAQADRRADGLPREAATPLRRVHPGARPPRRLGAPHGPRRCPDDDLSWTARRAALGRRGTARARCSTARPRPTGLRPASRSCSPSRCSTSTTGTPSTKRAFATGARRRGSSSATALARAGRRGGGRRPGLAKEGRDLELPPWNKGRYGTADRARGARSAPDRRPRDRRRARRDRGRPGRGRRRARARGDDRRARARPRSASDDGARRVRGRVLARDLRRGSARGHHARGLRRPRVPRTTTVSSSSTTRPTRSTRRLDARRPDRALPDPGRRVRARGRGGHRRTGRPLRASCSSHPTVHARWRSRATISRPRSPRCAARSPVRERPARLRTARARRRLRSAGPRPGRSCPGPERGVAVCHPGGTREGPPVLRRTSLLIVALGGAALAGSARAAGAGRRAA